METKTKLIWLELIGGILGWLWILASVAALYFLVMAVFSDSPWSRFFWAFGIGAIAKWPAPVKTALWFWVGKRECWDIHNK